MNKFLAIISLFAFAMNTATASEFRLKSPQIKKHQFSSEQVFNGFGCSGKNISPELSWSHPPKGTKSFALTMYDPDAPTGSGWWHWVVFNIPANVKALPRNFGNLESDASMPGLVQSRTDFGKPGYGGPCPPAGGKAHHYRISLYALKTDKIPLDKNASAAMVGFYIHQTALAKAVIKAKYKH